MTAAAKTPPTPPKMVYFCSQCFATDEDGSMGGTAFPNGCTNCGSSGPSLYVAEYHVKAIRAQASWIGKRFYPNDEDHASGEERLRLLALVKEFPGRSAVCSQAAGSGWYLVTQITGSKSTISTHIRASSPAEAIEKSRNSLPYFSEVPTP